MSVPRLTGQIGNRGYWMLVDSGSQSNVMTLQQAQDLALSIDISGNPWVLKGISGHLITLEGICWNVPIKIGGVLFPHNFFISRTVLGGKDIILGQPWLLSQMRVDYIYNVGVVLQLWKNGNRN